MWGRRNGALTRPVKRRRDGMELRVKGATMAKVFTGRYSADVEGDFVVFLIGMRINKLWNVRGWWHTFVSMRPMIKELEANPGLGLISAHHDVVRRPGRRPVLALVRAPRPLRAQRGPAPPPRVEEVEQGLARVRRGRHLARDLQGAARASTRSSTATCRATASRPPRRTCRSPRRAARPRGGSARRRRTSPPSPTPATDAGTSGAPGPSSAGRRTSAPTALSGRAIRNAVAAR